MIQQFVDRKEELRFLEEAYRSKRAELIILYGRRRIGKTEIIARFCKNKPHVYLLCTEDSERNNMEMFRDRFADFLGQPILKDITIGSWIHLFQRFLELLDKKEKVVIAIDEFPALIALNRGMPSIFQKLWDETLKTRNVMLILTGSSISMMETEVLGYKSPLYGRRTGQWRVESLDLRHLRDFFPRYSSEELVKTYAVIGGVPAYLQEFDAGKGLMDNISQCILKKGRYLYQEVEFLLKQEFREQRTYLTLLKKMALGAGSLGKLCAATGMDKANISKYLHVLENTQIIRHVLPLGRRKGGIYVIADQFFNFWLQLVAPHQADIEAGNDIKSVIEQQFPLYMGRMFEPICEEFLRRGALSLPLKLTHVQRWWHKDTEIDLVCLDKQNREALFIECKWSAVTQQQARAILHDLKEKSALVSWKRRKEYAGLIGKRVAGKEQLRKEGFVVFDLEDVERAMGWR